MYEYRPPRFSDEINAFVKCGICGRGAVLIVTQASKEVATGAFTLNGYFEKYPDEAVERAFFPQPDTPEVPDHLPENVKEYFLEAVANVKTAPDAAGAMFRKSVNVALKQVAQDVKGNLVGRINMAAEMGKLTPELAEWAHRVLLESNDAAHDEDPFTNEEAESLRRFTELLLMYLYTLPGMLAERRSQGDIGGEGETAV